jgi:2-oxoacid:acceptor oxidoreductase delta subunit (pyruvate/2-ketoisovalerate family)
MVIKHKNIFKTESPWSDANQVLLKLDTGSWRTERPILDKEKCNYCGICAMYCPPQCMKDMGEYYEADLTFCKGCGICAKECPRKAYTMKPEGEFINEG